MSSFIEVCDVTFKYDDNINHDIEILKNINLKIKKGEFVALLGHNGCGKSTLAKHFNAILLPSGGKIFVAGLDTKDENKKYDIRKSVGLILQNPDNQIVAIAGIIAMEPDCIVLDEPTAMLDPSGKDEVINTIIKLNKEKGVTIILITHFMEEAILSDRIVLMKDGNILKTGTPKEIFSDVEYLRRYKMDVPQSTELIYELNKRGLSLKNDILTEDECVNELVKLLEDRYANN